MKGIVYIMGSGPGDSELLTAQAVSILRTAEVVLHDDSISSKILDLIPASTQVRNVHKLALPTGNLEEKIHSLLISAAREGHQVVRLMATDPSQSALANQTADALGRASVVCELIPGAAFAVGTAAGANSRGVVRTSLI
jgi:uroporphyrin-III C-methyltransferase/precorrin-2 dehydrogenase/sirohydrochlorin ferrochelatase